MINELIGTIIGLTICFFIVNTMYELWHMYFFKKRYFRGTKEQIAKWRKQQNKEDEDFWSIALGMIVKH